MSGFVMLGKRSLLALELAAGNTVAEAAATVGVSERTVYRQLKKTDFREKVRQLKDTILDGATSRMGHRMNKAVDTLYTMLDDENSSIRIRASRAIIGLGLKMRDAVDTNERLNEVERELAERGLS